MLNFKYLQASVWLARDAIYHEIILFDGDVACIEESCIVVVAVDSQNR